MLNNTNEHFPLFLFQVPSSQKSIHKFGVLKYLCRQNRYKKEGSKTKHLSPPCVDFLTDKPNQVHVCSAADSIRTKLDRMQLIQLEKVTMVLPENKEITVIIHK